MRYPGPWQQCDLQNWRPFNQDCEEVIHMPHSPWHHYTFQKAAEYVPDDCDNLVDTQELSGMQRQQVRFRLYLTARRQLLTLLRRIKKMCE